VLSTVYEAFQELFLDELGA